MRADQKRRERNLDFASELKTLTKKFREHVKSGGGPQTQELFRTLVKRLDQAASKKIIHRNTASRKQGRLARSLRSVSTSKT